MDNFGSRVIRIAVLICFVLTLASMTMATTSEFRLENKKDFAACELEGVTLTDKGKIILSCELNERAALKDSQVWAVATDASGTIFAGTGNDGKLYAQKPGAKPELLFDSKEQQIHSVMVSKGRIYVGTGPSGIVFRIDAKTGKATTLYKTGEEYVWSLAAGPRGEVYAGTGPSGRVFKIDGPGKGKMILELEAKNIMTLHYDSLRKELFVGTSSGIVYSTLGSKGLKAHLEVEGLEVRTILPDGDSIFVLLTTESGGAMPSGPPPTNEAMAAALKARMSSQKGAGGPPPGKAPPRRPSRFKSAVYRIDKGGNSERIFESPDSTLFSMGWDKGDMLIFGYRGDEGVVVRLTRDGESDLLRSIEDAKFISACKLSGGGFAIGTSEVAKVFELQPNAMKPEGSIISKVLDAGSRSRWGMVTWDADTPKKTGVRLFTRSGEVSKVDESWNSWEGPLTKKEGSQCKSELGRYIQIKAVLSASRKAESPVLGELVVPYAQLNLSPKIRKIVVHDSGNPPSSIIRSCKAQGTNARNQKLKRLEEFSEMKHTKTLRAVTWQASDPNKDDLLYSVYMKGATGNWRPLANETPLTFYVIDTSTLSDGEYRFKVSVCDSPSNPLNEELCDEDESDAFTVDNTPPTAKIRRIKSRPDGSYLVRGTFLDASGNIQAAWLAIDEQPFGVVFAKDGIFDSKEEKFEVITPALSGGGHRLTLRVEDASGNVSVIRSELPK
ncbi:hypothetical protein J7M28_01595 [bacterium]|nr:hypothetical protein [bacterium]